MTEHEVCIMLESKNVIDSFMDHGAEGNVMTLESLQKYLNV